MHCFFYKLTSWHSYAILHEALQHLVSPACPKIENAHTNVSRLPPNSSALNWIIVTVLEGYTKMAARDKSAPSRNSVKLNQGQYAKKSSIEASKIPRQVNRCALWQLPTQKATHCTKCRKISSASALLWDLKRTILNGNNCRLVDVMKNENCGTYCTKIYTRGLVTTAVQWPYSLE